MRSHIHAILAVALNSVLSIAAADGNSCPITDEQFASQVSTMKDWSAIYSVFKRNLPACPDDGLCQGQGSAGHAGGHGRV